MKQLLLLPLLFIYLNGFSQDIRQSSQEIKTKLAFQLTAKEAKNIIQNGLNVVDSTFFHTCVDTIFAPQTFYKEGYYLFTSLDGNKLRVEFAQNVPFTIQFLNNTTDLNVLLLDKEGQFIKNATIYIDGKSVRYQEVKGIYQLKKRINKGLMEVDYDQLTYFFNIDTQYPQFGKRMKNRVLFTFPLKYVSVPIRNLKYAIKYKQKPRFIYTIQHFFQDPAYYIERKKDRYFETIERNSIVLLDKPKYLPKDTVHYKVILRNAKGKPLKKKTLAVRLYASGSKNLDTVTAYKKGLYEGFFVLNNSLNLRLDNYYTINFENKNGNTLASASFKLADYQLKSEIFTLENSQYNYYKNDTIQFKISGYDDSGLALSDANWRLTIQPERVYEFTEKQLFVPKNYWPKTGQIPATGQISFALPDSLQPNFSAHLQAIATFYTADNKVVTKTVDFDYYNRIGNGTKRNQFNSEESARRFDVLSSRTKDSIAIDINNPANLTYWYSIFYKNRKIEEVQDSVSKQMVFKAKSTKNYSINYHYLENGNIVSDNQTIAYKNKNLSIEMDNPMVISPGQEVELNITVSKANGKPQGKADITAMGITNKFTENSQPNLLDYSKVHRQRKIYNDFSFKDSNKESTYQPIHINQWKKAFGLDSSLFYQFLFPDNGIFQTEIPAKNRTEFAPFVIENGDFKEIKYILMDKIPIYFQLSSEGQRYSFSADTSKHHLTIRTSDKVIEVKNIMLSENKKTIISIDPSKHNSQVDVKQVSENANSQEVYMLNQLLFPLNSAKNLPSNSYLEQKRRVFFIETNSSNFVYLGPIS